MKVGRIFKWIGILLGGAVVLAAVFFLFVFNWNMLRAALGERASAGSGRDIEIRGDLDVDLSLTPSISAERIVVGNVEWGSRPHMAEIGRLVVSVRLRDLIGGDIVLPRVEIDRMRLLLEKNRGGEEANWDFGENPAAGAVNRAVVPKERADFPVIEMLRVTDGELTYLDPSRGIDVTMDVSTAQGEATDQRERVTLDGKGSFEGAPFELAIRAGSVEALRDAAEPYPISTDIRIGNTRGRLDGTISAPMDMKGVDVELTLEGANPAELFPIVGIPVPDMPPYRISGRLVRQDEEWVFRDFSGKVGDSDLSGELAFRPGEERPFIRADLTSDMVDFEDLGGFVGATPEGARKSELSEGRADTTREEKGAEKGGKPARPAVEETDGRKRVLPDTPFNLERLRAVDADVRFRGTRVRAPNLPIDDLDAHLTIERGLLRFAPLNFGVAAGDIRSQIVVDARSDVPKLKAEMEILHVKLDSLFRGTDFRDELAGEFAGRANLSGEGRTTREVLAGAAGDVSVLMDRGRFSALLLSLASLDIPNSLANLLGDDESIAVRCLVADFSVGKGVMSSRALVFDTETVNIIGSGIVDLGEERLDLEILAHPKDPGLGARTPIEIGGTFAAPEIGPDEAALGVRAGAAAALGALLTPLGALIPFVELGLGEDSNCAKLIGDARKNTEGPPP